MTDISVDLTDMQDLVTAVNREIGYLAPLLRDRVHELVEGLVTRYLAEGVRPEFPLVVRLPVLIWSFQGHGLSAEFRHALPTEAAPHFIVDEAQFDTMARLLATNRSAHRPPG